MRGEGWDPACAESPAQGPGLTHCENAALRFRKRVGPRFRAYGYACPARTLPIARLRSSAGKRGAARQSAQVSFHLRQVQRPSAIEQARLSNCSRQSLVECATWAPGVHENDMTAVRMRFFGRTPGVPAVTLVCHVGAGFNPRCRVVAPSWHARNCMASALRIGCSCRTARRAVKSAPVARARRSRRR